MEVDQSGGILVVDVHRNGKRQLEAAVAHAVVSVVERLRAIAIGEGSLRSVFLCIIQFAGDRLLGIANGGCNNAVENRGALKSLASATCPTTRAMLPAFS